MEKEKTEYEKDNYPLEAREDIIQFLLNHHSYHPMNSWNGGFCVAWNVKMHKDTSIIPAKYREEFKIDPARDEQWDAYLDDEGRNIFEWITEDMVREFCDGEFTRYPGEGFVKCYFNGRMGGHMVLEDCDLQSGGDNPWALNKFVWSSKDGYEEWLREMEYHDLLAWYKMIRDVDVVVANRYDNFAFYLADRRAQWEQEKIIEEKVKSDPVVQIAKQNILSAQSVISEREMEIRKEVS